MKLRRITRVKNGYRVRMQLPTALANRLNRETYSKSFTKPTYHTLRECQAEAIKLRDRLEKRWNLKIRDWESQPGVRRVVKHYYIATWFDGQGHQKAFAFDPDKRGSEARAKKAAMAFREKMGKL